MWLRGRSFKLRGSSFNDKALWIRLPSQSHSSTKPNQKPMEVPTGYGFLGTFLRPRGRLSAGRQQSLPHFETLHDNHAWDCQLFHLPPFQSDGPAAMSDSSPSRQSPGGRFSRSPSLGRSPSTSPRRPGYRSRGRCLSDTER